MAWDEAAYRERHNVKVREALAEAKEGRGYVLVGLTTPTVHGSVATVKGHNGYVHPRTLCQPHSPRSYAWINDDQDGAATCLRCLAGLAKRGIPA